ncbi:YihY/virulence factor BrkB family protein [Thermomonospora umbrina]|uniref:Membrane protein n=1 Tax=Thermomonospora umbrina TaxID=111806 RepID=A0A3D9SW68_9ACTN|nr:YihY/virulence factor BrkB family protein [Thermomonospora umbrina]REE98263.1 membrane protein [Thermomonospora umbrina]
MARVIDGVRQGAVSWWHRWSDGLRERRRRWPWLDHLFRAHRRYAEQRGDRSAAAITFYGFLSFFPLVALAYALLGYLVGVSRQARDYLVQAISELMPGLAADVDVAQIAQARGTAGAIGLAGLLIAGLGWMNAVRESLRDIWLGDPTGGGNIVLKKLADLGMLAFLGTTMIISVAVSTVTTRASHVVLGWLHLAGTPGAGTGLRLLSLAVAIGFNTLIFLVLFSRLSGTHAPWHDIVRGALFGAVGFEILKLTGTLLIGHTLGNPVYASFAAVAGLLLWIDVVSRFVLFAAAWTATRRVVLSADAANRANQTEDTAPMAVLDDAQTPVEPLGR